MLTCTKILNNGELTLLIYWGRYAILRRLCAKVFGLSFVYNVNFINHVNAKTRAKR